MPRSWDRPLYRRAPAGPAFSKAASVKTAESARKTMAQMLFLVSGCSFGSRSSRERDSGRDEVFSMTVFLYLLCGRAMSVGNAKCLYYNVSEPYMKKDIHRKGLIVFDFDGTLAETKSEMDTEMAGLIRKLLQEKKVAVIGGGKYELFKSLFVR